MSLLSAELCSSEDIDSRQVSKYMMCQWSIGSVKGKDEVKTEWWQSAVSDG